MTTIKEAEAQKFIREMQSITAESEYLEGKEQDAYAQGFKDAVAMAYIQLTGTANGKGFIDTLIEQTIKEERERMVAEAEKHYQKKLDRGEIECLCPKEGVCLCVADFIQSINYQALNQDHYGNN